MCYPCAFFVSDAILINVDLITKNIFFARIIRGRASAISIVSKIEHNTLRILAHGATYALDAQPYKRVARPISFSAMTEMRTGEETQTQAGLLIKGEILFMGPLKFTEK